MPTVTGSPAASRLRLSHRHESILIWLIQNPHRTKGECAREFGYTASTLSNIINSDLFQHVYRSRCEEMGEIAVHTMSAKLGALGTKLVEKIEERLDAGSASERLLIDGTKTVLDALGYTSRMAKPSDEPTQHLHVHVSGSDIQEARERASRAFRGQSFARISDPDTQVSEALAPSPSVSDLVGEIEQKGSGNGTSQDPQLLAAL